MGSRSREGAMDRARAHLPFRTSPWLLAQTPSFLGFLRGSVDKLSPAAQSLERPKHKSTEPRDSQIESVHPREYSVDLGGGGSPGPSCLHRQSPYSRIRPHTDHQGLPSFLHVYEHAATPVIHFVWLAWCPTGFLLVLAAVIGKREGMS